MNKVTWYFLDKFKPKTTGSYLVIWSEPYSKKASIAVGYFISGRFINNPAGANEIIMWANFPELPEISKELRTRRVKND